MAYPAHLSLSLAAVLLLPFRRPSLFRNAGLVARAALRHFRRWAFSFLVFGNVTKEG